FRPPRQHVPAFRAAPRFHKAALLQAGQDQLQKLLRNLLPAGDLSDLHGLNSCVCSKIENRLQRVFTLDRNVHWRITSNPPAKLEIRGFSLARQHCVPCARRWATRNQPPPRGPPIVAASVCSTAPLNHGRARLLITPSSRPQPFHW